MKHYLDAMKKYATFSGRATRTEYWMFMLIQSVILIALFGAMFAVLPGATGGGSEAMAGLFGIVAIVVALAHVIPGIAVAVRRCHDFDVSGWLYLTLFIPLVGYFMPIVFGCISPTPGANRFGADPRGGASLADLEAFGEAPKPAFDPATGGLVRA